VKNVIARSIKTTRWNCFQRTEGAFMFDLPSAVLWAGGFAAFFGFILGSFPPNDEYAGIKFDFPGALIWALAAGGAVGGLFLWVTTGAMIGLAAVGIGAALGGLRMFATRGPSAPKGQPVQDGVNRFVGDSSKAKFKAAERMYRRASFANGEWYATRSPRDWRFGDEGMDAETLSMLADATAGARSNVLEVLVLLVRELPGQPGEPGVIVVRGTDKLRAVTADKSNNALVIPDVGTVPGKTIAGAVGYAWRSNGGG
jgi:hypothetical protein